jgi:transposase InsO family protein
LSGSGAKKAFNGYNERFNGMLRRSVLNAEWLTTTNQAEVVINQWLRQHNHIHQHQALNMHSPVPEILIRNGTELRGQTDRQTSRVFICC